MISNHQAHTRRQLLTRHARFCVRFALSLLVFLLPLATHNTEVFAQDGTATIDDVLRVRTDLVTVPLIVTDGRGRRVGGLTQSDFAVRDAGRTVKVEYFAAGATRVALAFALDASGSAREHLAEQQEAALALFKRFADGSRVAVLHFREAAELVVPFTTDASAASSAFDFPALANRRTAIFDAALRAVRLFDKTDPAERRIIILISDGLDTASATNAKAVIKEANERGVSFYVIHFPLFTPGGDGRLVARSVAKGFRDLAERTGGRYFMIGDAASALDTHARFDLAPVFKSIEEDLQAQYVVGFYPNEAARNGQFHRIEIDLATRDKRKLRVRTLREGYILKQ